MESKAVHFIIPCYRAGKTLGNTLTAIFSLDYPQDKIQVSVVENGRQESVLASILKHYPQVSYYFLPKKSRSQARNYLVSQITESYIAYVDADVILDQDWLKHCMAAIAPRSVGVVQGSIYREGDSFIDHVRKRVSFLGCRDFNMLEPKRGFPTLNAAAMLIRKACLEQVGLFDEGLVRYEDTDLSLRLMLNGVHLRSVPKAKCRVEMSDTIATYLSTRPLVMGYCQAKSLARYGLLPSNPLDRLARMIPLVFSNQRGPSPFFVNACVFWIKWLLFIGSLAGQITTGKCRVKVRRENNHLTIILSWDGTVYILNPLLALCFQEKALCLVDIQNNRNIVLEGHLGELLGEVISSGKITERQNGEAKYFIENGILVRLKSKAAMSS